MNAKDIRRPGTEDFVTLTDLWRICMANRRWFVLSLCLCLGFAFYYLFTTPPLYTREAAVLVKQEQMGKSAVKTPTEEDFNNIGLVQQSTNVANVQRELTSLRVLTEVCRRLFPKECKNETDALRKAEGIRGRLKAKIENDKSTIVNITYTDPSPLTAERVLNMAVQVYNEQWVADKNLVTANASRFIQDRLTLLEKELGNVDDSISAFKMRNNITSLEQVSDIYLQQQSQSDAEILRLTNQKSMAEYILGILRDKSTRNQLLPTNSGINNVVAETQINLYNTMLMQLKSNLYGTSAQNPLIIKQEAELEDVRGNIFATITNQIKTIDIQLQALQGYNGEASSKLSSNPEQAKHLVSVEREQKVKESLYLYLLQKKEENEINQTYTSLNTQVIDMPHGSDLPTSPNTRMVLLVAVLVAMVIPVAVLFVKESMNTTVRDRYDIEHRSTLPLIGEVPFFDFSPKSLWQKLRSALRRVHRHGITRDIIVVKPDSQNLINEAFRIIRTNLEFMTGKGHGGNVYIVTSGNQGSGKTFVSVNLAVALAIKERKVLLIDGDLRRASATRCFHPKSAGLADYLGERYDNIDELIIESQNYPNLSVLPVGTIPPNPTELLSGDRLSRLIAEVRHRYDFVLIDCPPTTTLADVDIIERYADRTLFIVRAGLFVRKRIADLEADVASGHYKHLSVILNASEMGSRYGYRYGTRYGKYGRSYY